VAAQKNKTQKPIFFHFKFFTMKNLIILMFSIFILSFLPSCKKEDDTTPLTNATVQGRILQVYSTIPVANATVYLYETIASGNNAYTVSLDTVITNDKGEYSFKYKRGSISNEYFIRAFAKNFDNTPGNFYIKQKNSPSFDVPIFPYAWIGFRIINVPPFSNSDGIDISGYLQGSDQVSSIGINGRNDTTIIKKVIGNQKTSINIYTSNEKGKIVYTDSVYCKGLDTTYHTITY
jgi:hypothetical protein